MRQALLAFWSQVSTCERNTRQQIPVLGFGLMPWFITGHISREHTAQSDRLMYCAMQAGHMASICPCDFWVVRFG